jgi:hypothetical protein
MVRLGTREDFTEWAKENAPRLLSAEAELKAQKFVTDEATRTSGPRPDGSNNVFPKSKLR